MTRLLPTSVIMIATFQRTGWHFSTTEIVDQQCGLFSFMKVSIEEKFNCDMNNDNHDGARPDHPDVFLQKTLLPSRYDCNVN
jgi:hypothetical protein